MLIFDFTFVQFFVVASNKTEFSNLKAENLYNTSLAIQIFRRRLRNKQPSFQLTLTVFLVKYYIIALGWGGGGGGSLF